MDDRFKIVYKRRKRNLKVCRKCWSYRRRCYKGLPILPPIRDQGQNGTCLLYAIRAIMEAKLRLNGVSVTLSVDNLEANHKLLLSSLPESDTRTAFDEVNLVLMQLTRTGILSDKDFKMGRVDGPRYKIKQYRFLNWMKAITPSVVENLRNEGPLLAIIKVSNNYTSDFLSRWIYQFDKAKTDGPLKTHAVMVTGYGIDALLSFWEMMNSHGKIGKQKGFGCFDFESLVGLYSIDM